MAWLIYLKKHREQGWNTKSRGYCIAGYKAWLYLVLNCHSTIPSPRDYVLPTNHLCNMYSLENPRAPTYSHCFRTVESLDGTQALLLRGHACKGTGLANSFLVTQNIALLNFTVIPEEVTDILLWTGLGEHANEKLPLLWKQRIRRHRHHTPKKIHCNKKVKTQDKKQSTGSSFSGRGTTTTME